MAVGAISISHGYLHLSSPGGLSLEAALDGVLSSANGGVLLLGFLTPVVGTVAAISSMAIALSWLPTSAVDPFDQPWPALLSGIVSIAIIFLGPGSISVDARLFGRREIVIPVGPRPPE